MQKVVFFFPDNVQLANFIEDYQPPNTEVNTKEHSATTYVDDDDILVVEREYEAYTQLIQKAQYLD
jgi:hypothetical protein